MQVVDVNGNMFGYDHLEIIGPDGRPKNIISTTYVPYTGAITDVDLGAHSLKADYLEVDQNTVHVVSTAQIGWNETDGTFDMGMLNGVTLQAGQELYFYAKATEAITNGQAVQFAGAQGSHLLIKRAVPSEINANSEYFVGVATQDFATNDFGYVTSFGKVRDLNTLAYPEGTILYFAAGGSTPGALTSTEPSAPNAKILVAAVVRSHGTQGTLLVRPHVMPKIKDIQDINVTGATSGQVLTYNGSIWVPTTPTIGTVTSVTASAPLSSSGGTTPNITISQSSGTDDGYLSSADWTTFNSKQPAGNYITSLSGEATGSGPGTASVTLNNASVTAKVLTGVNITGGSISASDSILTAFGKLQNQINGLIGSSVYQGTWNASTNTPALASGVGTRGYYYIVNVAGSTNLDGITDWNVGDWAIFDGTAWQQVDNTDSVTSVNGQTGAVSLTTDNIPEGATNLYFTQLRARQSINLTTSGSSGASTYNNSTGALNIPNYTLSGLGGVPSSRRLEINGISYDLSADRSWSVGTVTSIATSGPLTGGTITGSGTIGITQATPFTDGYLSYYDWNTFNNKQDAITLTTTGTSGAATLIGSTLNIPQYQSVITNPVTGTGAANYVARWTSSSNIGTGILYDTGSLVGVNTTAPGKTLDVFGDVRFQSANSRIDFTVAYNGLGDLPAGILLSTWATANNNLAIIPSAQGTAGSKVVLGAYNGSTWKSMVQFENVSSGDPNLILAANGGNVGISTSTPSYKLEVQGNTFINDYLFIANGSSLRFTTNNIYIRPEVSGGSWADLAFYTDNTEKVRITRAGSVGIGNSSPGYKLDVAGNFRATNGIVNEANHDNTRFDNILPASVNGSGAGTVQMGWWVSEPGISWNNGGFGYNVTNDGASPYGFGRINTSLGQAYMRFEASGFLYFYNTNTSGTRFETMTLSDAGAIRFNQYGSGTKTGTRAYDLAVDSSGNIIEVPVGAGTVTGSGTANYVARWTSSSNISTGVLYDNGTNVGIGTTAPYTRLDVTESIPYISVSSSMPIESTTDGQAIAGINFRKHYSLAIGASIRQLQAGGTASYGQAHLAFYTNDVSVGWNDPIERMRITAGGNVGIATTNPLNTLQVGSVGSTGYNGNNIAWGDGTRAGAIYINSNASYLYASGDQILAPGSGEKVRITSVGNVGIGTSSPSQRLDVYGYIKMSGTSNAQAILGGTTSSWYGDIQYPTLYSTAADKWIMHINPHIVYVQNGVNGYTGTLTGSTIRFASDSSFTTYWDLGIGVNSVGGDKYSIGRGSSSFMAIDNVGNFGIGTSSPLSKLHVDGNSGIRISAASNSDYRGIIFAAAAGDSTEYSSIKWQPNSGEFRISANPSGFGGYMSFYSNAAEAMRITASGNVGIGTTSPTVKLEVSGQAFVDKFQYNQGIQISGVDLDTITTAGFYAGSSLGNAPNAGWFYVTVERHSDAGWVHQLATSYGAGNTENEIYSRVRMYASTWMPWKKIAYSSDVPTATSVYDLLPNARVDYTWVGQVVDGTWVDVFTRANNVLTSGTWIVNMYVNDNSTGGAHYTYNYSGTFTWFQNDTNQSGTPSASEIALHRMGHAANSTVLYLRTKEETAADGGNGRFQISANYSHFANTTITFKFVKII